MKKYYNCKDCLYANERNDGSIYCDRRSLYDGVNVYITAEDKYLSCPVHSSIDREETRADRPWNYNSQADDVCGVCHRTLKLHRKDTYIEKEVEVENADGNIGTKNIKVCVICEKKGR